MPEGPEIRLAADRIAAAIEGCIPTEIWFAHRRLQRRRRVLEGRRIERVEPRGKALIVRFDGGWNLYSHNQLYGRWYVVDRGVTPKTNRQLRVALHTDNASALLYSASDIEMLRDDELEAHPYLERLGPDVLDPRVKPSRVRSLLDAPRFSRRALGGLLLDQGFLGGIGNYLRSEILWVARLHPAVRPDDLDRDARFAFSRAALAISRRAYRTRGVTNDAATVRKLRADGASRREYRHFVFDRDGLPCYRCGTGVVRSSVAGRRLYACPKCQPRPA